MMLQRSRPASITYVAYLLVLLTFVSLGVFVAALAHRSGIAAIAGAGVAGFLSAAVIGFRVGAAALARASKAAGSTHKLSIWADPLRPNQLEAYRANYRGDRQRSQQRRWSPTLVADTESAASITPQVDGREDREPVLAARQLSA